VTDPSRIAHDKTNFFKKKKKTFCNRGSLLKLQRGNFKNILKKKEKSKRRTLVKENRYRRRHSWLVSLIAQRVPERRLQTKKNLQLQQPGALGGTSDATRRQCI
jgi:predicted RNA-binding protein Jag